ncbi:MAG: xanthine dehydrogenase [Telmatospirillum sp.]|nr:xanthine dehydrogenase [Telmatospirillum sp.]
MSDTTGRFPSRRSRPFAVILGTDEIASAVAIELYRRNFGVVLSHNPATPVIRRRMAFHDALFDDPVRLDGVVARSAPDGAAVRQALAAGDGVTVTDLGLLDLVVVRSLDLLIDARLQKRDITPDLRHLARFTIGLGPAFRGGGNCDVAIETRPDIAGAVIAEGPTAPYDGKPALLGGRGRERFLYAPFPGRWHTPFEIGMRVFKDYPIGQLGSLSVDAPFDGVVRGLVRDGTEVPAGVKLLEIDARGRTADVTGPDARAQAVARGVGDVIDSRALRPLPLARTAE